MKGPSVCLAHCDAGSTEAPLLGNGVLGGLPPHPPGSRGHSPEAVAVVQLALGQVALNQVHMLPAGRARAAGGPLGALLRQAARRQLLALQGVGWAEGHRAVVISLPVLEEPPSLQ